MALAAEFGAHKHSYIPTEIRSATQNENSPDAVP